MKIYWDSSALIKSLHDPDLRFQLDSRQHGTRLHTLTEIFSTLTRGVSFRYSPQDAATLISDLAEDLAFVELTRSEVLAAIKNARRLGVRGARIHDLLHAAAAQKFNADLLLTLDTPGFHGLTQIEIRSP